MSTDNTPPPAQALGECLKLSEKATPGRWFSDQHSPCNEGMEDAPDVSLWGADGDSEEFICNIAFDFSREADSHLAAAAVNFIRQHGQHFAGLEAELRDWQNLLTAVIAPRGLPGVSVEYPKLWPFDGGQDAAMVAFALHTAIERAEAAEARCSELEVECADLRKRHHETLIAWEAEITNSGYAEARVRGA